MIFEADYVDILSLYELRLAIILPEFGNRIACHFRRNCSSC